MAERETMNEDRRAAIDRLADFSMTDDERRVVIRALDDYTEDSAERSADMTDDDEKAAYYASESKAAGELLARLQEA